MKILVLNGPNLDMLGIRKPEVYGTSTLRDIEDMVSRYALEYDATVCFAQSNHEGELIDWVHRAQTEYDGVVYNPGAHAHYSYAIRDAIESITTPVVEVHISDTASREDFRAIDVIEPVCLTSVVGKGIVGYLEAFDIVLAAARFDQGE